MRRRITIWGIAMTAALIASPFLAANLARDSGLPVMPALARYLPGAALGWLLTTGLFAAEDRARGLAIPMWAILLASMVIAFFVDGIVLYGLVGGTALRGFHTAGR